MSSLFGIGGGGNVGASGSFYGYSIDQSLRFDGSSSYLNFTPSSAATDSSKITFSTWLKTWGFGISDGYILSAGSSYIDGFAYNSNSQFTSVRNGGTGGGSATASGLRRDPSAWYHLYIIYDADAGYNRIYVNGVLEGEASTSSDLGKLGVNGQVHRIMRKSNASTYLDLYLAETHFVDGSIVPISTFAETKNGVWTPVQTSGITYGNNGWYLDYADTSDVGKDVSGRGNHWTANNLAAHDVVPDSPTNNWCTLNYNDSRTSQGWKEGGLNWLASSLTYTAHSTMVIPEISDSDIYYAECRCNSTGYARGISPVTLSGANNNTSVSGMLMLYDNGRRWNGSTYLGSGNNEYATISAGDVFGIKAGNGELRFFQNGNDLGAAFTGLSGSYKFANFAAGATGTGQTWNFGQDSTFHGQETAGTTTDQNGLGLFKYSDASDCIALCAANIAEPTIGPNSVTQADDHFNTVLYTGNGTGQSIAGVGFQPSWVWLKTRSVGYQHSIYDSVRGGQYRLASDQTTTEVDNSSANLQSFDADGFTVGTLINDNQNSVTYVGWNWKAGGATPTKTYKLRVDADGGQNKYRFRNSADDATFATYAPTVELQEGGTYVFDWSHSTAQAHNIRFSTTSDGTWGGGSEYTTGVVKDDTAYTTTITVAAGAPTLYYYCQNHSGMGGQVNTNSTHGQSNFDGTLQSVVSANTDAGFSIVSYQGTGANTNVGHGLSSAPELIIIKRRDNGSGATSWKTGSSLLTSWTYRLKLNDTNAQNSESDVFNDTAPTNTVFSLGTDVMVNGSGGTFISYCFHSVPGYSKVGSYVGNGNANGTFVFTGFRPAWVMIKKITATGNWILIDAERSAFNLADDRLIPNSTSTEADGNGIDMLSNGFKTRSTDAQTSTSGATFIYLAFAEAPFKYANAR